MSDIGKDLRFERYRVEWRANPSVPHWVLVKKTATAEAARQRAFKARDEFGGQVRITRQTFIYIEGP